MHSPKLPAFFREPLVQFLTLGILIFAVDEYILLTGDNPKKIVVDQGKLADLIGIFREGQGREPTPKEIDNLIVKWTQNEIMFREALKMELDKGDEMIRSRLILKMHNILFNNVAVDVPPTEKLEKWFEKHRTAYDKPAYYDVEQFQLSGMEDETAASSMAAALGTDPPATRYSNALRRYSKRPASAVAALFDEQSRSDLLGAPVGAWVVARSAKGLHLARVTRRYEPVRADFGAIKSRVVRDWKNFSNKKQLAVQTKAIANRYEIQLNIESSGRRKTNQQATSEQAEQPTALVRQ